MRSGAQPVKLSDKLDTDALAGQFARDQRVQIRDVLDEQSAVAITRLLIEQTPWGVSWQAGEDGPHR